MNEELRGYLEDDGTLAKYAWPGGYPLYYLDANGDVLCPDCANANDEYNAPLAAAGIHWEGPAMHCDHCGAAIASAYGDPDE